MKEFDIPIVFTINADTKKDARNIVEKSICEAGMYTLENEPDLHDRVVRWDFAVIKVKG